MNTSPTSDIEDQIDAVEAEVGQERHLRGLHLAGYAVAVVVLLGSAITAIVAESEPWVPPVGYGACVLLVVIVAYTGYLLWQRDRLVVLRSKLSRLRERRKEIATGELRPRGAAYVRYRDGIPDVIERQRMRAHTLRRTHNTLQAVVVAGSILAATLIASAAVTGWARWVAVFFTLATALSAGAGGYFRFRERGLNLQYTANQIEREFRAAELRISEYQGKTDEAVLIALAMRVEEIRNEQRGREQQLDQPSELRYAPLDDRE